ncbi:hypothetical protein [Streptococcus sp.]
MSDQLTYQLEANHHKFLLQQQVNNQELTESVAGTLPAFDRNPSGT